jgi:hypothetical protein
MSGYVPFRERDAPTHFRGLLQAVCREIDTLDNQYVLNAAPTELEAYFVQKATVTPLTLHVEQRAIEARRGVDIDVSRDFRYGGTPGRPILVRGTEVAIGIPYDGDPALWSLSRAVYPQAACPPVTIQEDRIILSIQYLDADSNSDQLREEHERQVRLLTDAVAALRGDVEQHNAQVLAVVPERLTAKRKTATAAEGVLGALGLPVVRRDGAPLLVPVQRRKLLLSRPTATQGTFQPEPVLHEAVYEEVLKALRSMSLVIERNRSSFQRLGEEQVRDHFLINLNNLFEGQATGETFNAAGKTDILIRVDDRTVFIGECKMWSGPSDFGNAIDQLLSYLTWRDCKCALLVFNTNKDSAGVSAKMHNEMTRRKEFRRTVANDPDEGGRYVLVKQDEPGREIIVSTLVFDIQKKA